MVRVRPVLQRNIGDCGVAAAQWFAKHYRINVTYGDLLEKISPGRDGAGLKEIRDALKSIDLNVVAYRFNDCQALSQLLPAILPWNNDHFVVATEIVDGGSKLHLMDPAQGFRVVDVEELDVFAVGVALAVKPGSTYINCDTGTTSPIGQRLAEFYMLAGFVWSLLRQSLSKVLLVMFLSALLGIAGSVPSVLVGRYIDGAKFNPDSDYLLLEIGIAIGGMFVLMSLLSIVRGLLSNRLDYEIESKLAESVSQVSFHMTLDGLRRLGVGQVFVKFQSMYAIRDVVSSRIIPLVGDLVFSFVVIFLLYRISPIHSLTVILLGVCLVGLLSLTSQRAFDLSQRVIDTSSRAHGTLTESLINFNAVKMAGQEDVRRERWIAEYRNSLDAVKERKNFDSILESSLGGLGSVYPLLWILISLAAVPLSKSGSVGEIVTVMTLSGYAIVPVQRIATNFQGVVGSAAEFENVTDLLKMIPENMNPDGYAKGTPKSIDIVDATLVSQSGEVLIDGLNISMPEGSFTAIIGESGVGKTTLLTTMLGSSPGSHDSVLVDGRPISELNLQFYRQKVGYLDQNPMLFSGTIRDNVAMGRRGVSDAQILSALEDAGLGDFINDLPLGISTLITADGGGLSGGQAQRLCFARAIVERPSLVILDEPTANLDSETEKRFFEMISRMNTTRIVVTHNKDMANRADQIIKLEAGGVVRETKGC